MLCLYVKRAHHIKMQFSNLPFGRGLFDPLIHIARVFYMSHICSCFMRMAHMLAPAWHSIPVDSCYITDINRTSLMGREEASCTTDYFALGIYLAYARP